MYGAVVSDEDYIRVSKPELRNLEIRADKKKHQSILRSNEEKVADIIEAIFEFENGTMEIKKSLGGIPGCIAPRKCIRHRIGKITLDDDKGVTFYLREMKGVI